MIIHLFNCTTLDSRHRIKIEDHDFATVVVKYVNRNIECTNHE